jgi:hypothetical protein
VKVGPSWFQPVQTSYLIIVWHLIMSASFSVSIFIGPFDFVFDTFYDDLHGLCWTLDILYLIDILLNFVLIKTDSETINPYIIAQTYFCRTFWPDLLITLPSVLYN